MIFQTKTKLIIAIAGLMVVFCSSLTAMAFEIQNGSVSQFLATVKSKDINSDIKDNKIVSSTNKTTNEQTAATTPQEAQLQPAPVPTETTAQSTTNTTKSKKKTSPNGSGSKSSKINTSGSDSSSSGSSDSFSSNSSSGSAGANSSNGSGSNNSGSGNSSSSNIFGNYSNSSVESIVGSLELVLDDALGDYTEPGGGEPAEGVFDYPPIDQDNVYMGVNGGRLYFKWTLGGTIPTSRETVGSNTIKTLTYNLHINTDGNPEASPNCGGVETSFQINISYNDSGQIWYVPWFSANCTNSEPYQTGHDWQFEKTGSGLAHTYNSGVGKNSIVYSYALSDLANTINVGAAVKLDISSEAESNNYEHYSYDQNLNERHRPTWVDWTIREI